MNPISPRDASERGRHGLSLAAATAAAAALISSAGAAPVPGPGPAAGPDPALVQVVNRQLGLRRSRLVRLGANPVPGAPLITALEIDGRMVSLDLDVHSVRAENYHVYLSDAAGNLTETEPVPVNTLQGVVIEDPGSLVAAGVDEDGLYARIEFSDGRLVWVEPAAATFQGRLRQDLAGLHVVYHAEDVLPDDGICGAVARERLEPPALAGGPARGEADGVLFTAEIAFDVDVAYFNRWGESGAQSRINFIVASGLNIEYPRDVGVTYEITTIIIRMSQVYTAGTIDGLLNQFRARWLQFHDDIQRDVAELFTGRDLSGNVIGIAFFAGICNDNGFNVVEDLGQFSCRTDLSAHELGHNWNADHCSCPNNTMNASLTCRNIFHPTFTIPEIIAFRDTRQCLDGPPTNDNCDNAMTVLAGSFDFDTTDASTDGPDLPASCDEGSGLSFVQDVWYRFIAPCDGTATASLCTSSYDTRMAVYNTGAECPGTLVACNDNGCGDDGLKSEVSFPVEFAQQFLVRVGGFDSGGPGTLVLTCNEGQACPEDLDGSGDVGFSDLLAVLAAWGPCGGCPEDLDGDGDVGFSDLLAILAAWGPCP